MRKKPDFSAFEIPEQQRRRGSFIIRIALKQAVLRQHPAAMRAAARMLLVLPVFQAAVLVGVLNAEPWLLLLSAEGLLIAWLAASQLKRPSPENRLIGLGLGSVNLLAMAMIGAFIGAPVLWITSVAALVPFGWLLLRRTRRRTIFVAWSGFALPLLLLACFAGFTRLALEQSRGGESQDRVSLLEAAWHGLQLRGGNGAERALLRLRQAQAAFDTGDFQAAFELANDGLQNQRGVMRAIPDSPLGHALVDSLIALKAQAHYNRHWGKSAEIYMAINDQPLGDELASHPAARIRWGW